MSWFGLRIPICVVFPKKTIMNLMVLARGNKAQRCVVFFAGGWVHDIYALTFSTWDLPRRSHSKLFCPARQARSKKFVYTLVRSR